MKKINVLLILLSIIASTTLAQNSSLFNIIDKQEKKLKVELNKPPSDFTDYLEITTLCKKLAENYKRLGYEADTETGKGSNFRKSLMYYSDEARYANIAAEKFGNRYMLQVSAKACKKAAFVYRALGKPKKITLLNNEFIDTCGLLPKDEESISEKPDIENDNTNNSVSDRRVVFIVNKLVFSMNVPYPLEAETIFGTKPTYYTSKEISKIIKEKGTTGFSKLTLNKFGIKGYQISIEFGAYKVPGSELLIQPKESTKTRNDRTFSIGDEDFPLEPFTAKLIYHWVWEIDNPIHSKDDLMASNSILFMANEYSCELKVGVRNLDEHKIEKKVMEMIRSFRVESPKSATKSKCKDGSIQLLAKGIPVSWAIYDRSRSSVVVQQPVLARDHEIAAAASNYIGAILKVIEISKDIKQIISIPRDVIIEGDLKKALITLGGWHSEGYHKMEIIPVEIENYSDVTIDGSLTNAVIFYLKALRDVSNGVSGLGKKINKMSYRVYWEIPIIEIKGECIPRMVCDNGVWKPDREYMEFREISRTKKIENSPNKDFMSVKQVADDLQRYYYALLDDLEDDEINYRNVLERCNESKKGLWKIDFPVNFDKCPDIENEIQLNQHEVLLLTQNRKMLNDELDEWVNKLKPAEIKRLNERLVNLAKEIQIMNNKIPELEELRDNFLNSGHPEKAAEISDQIAFLREDIKLLESFQTKTNNELTKISSGKKEADINKEISSLTKQISDLNREKEDLKKQLEVCLIEAEKVR